ncbi:hypothetical protein EDB19DRAFT_1907639 [Suillus lakei]|nr:hypothetical protein EDB19DRAFT_1907639 [Suillus lakei]
MALVKTLTFESTDLGIDVDILLTFDDQPMAGMYKNYFPSAFAVRKFGPDGTYRSDIKYRSQFAFTKVVPSNDIIQSTLTYVSINVGQSTILTKEDDVYSFSDPKIDPSAPKNNIQCTNNAPSKEDIGVGLIEKDGEVPQTALVWRGVEPEGKLIPEFTPILRGYIGTDYKQDSLIRGQVETDRLFEQNLDILEDHTTWVITYDPSIGVVSIDQK